MKTVKTKSSTIIATTTLTSSENMICIRNNDICNLLPVTLATTTTTTPTIMPEVMNIKDIDLMRRDKIDKNASEDYDGMNDLKEYNDDDYDDDGDDEDDDEEDDEFDESDTTDILDDVEAASLLISSDEEAELEAQRIRFPITKKKKSQISNAINITESKRNISAPVRIVTTIKESNEINSTTQMNVYDDLSFNHNNNNTNYTKNLSNASLNPRKCLEIVTAVTTVSTITTITKTATTTAAPTSLAVSRHSQSCISNLMNVSPLPEENLTRLCGNIYIYSVGMTFVFHCEYCDTQYSDLDKFVYHLYDTHKICMNEEYEKENSPRNVHQRSITTTNIINRSDPNVKKEPLINVEQHASISNSSSHPQPVVSSTNEPLEYCAKIYIVNQCKLLLQCVQCGCKYNDMHLLKTHLQQQHLSGEKQKQNNHNKVHNLQVNNGHSSDGVVKKEVYIISEVMEKSSVRIHQDNASIKVKINESIHKDNDVSSKVANHLSDDASPISCDNLTKSLEKETFKTTDIPQLVTDVTDIAGKSNINNIEMSSDTLYQEVKRSRGRPRKNQKKGNQKSIISVEPKNLRRTLKRKVQTPVEVEVINNTKELSKNEKARVKNYKKNTSASTIVNKQLKVNSKSQKVYDKDDRQIKESIQEEKDSLSFYSIDEQQLTSTATVQSISEVNLPTETKNVYDTTRVATLKRYTCEQCGRSFAKYSRLMEHERLHTGEKPFNCNQCGKHFRIKMRLSEHQLRHSKDKKYKCEMCGLALATRQDLTLHMRHHTGDRRYQCNSCPKAFVRSSDLKIHVRIHTGEKPYICDICNKSFRANQNLIVHKKSHMGNDSKTYKCEQCDKRFMRNIDRKVHMRTHTGEKPYKCEICQRGYSSRVHVRSHIQREHVAPNGASPKSKKKPGPKPKVLREELAKHKKLIEELKQQLMQQIKTDDTVQVNPLEQSNNVEINKQETDNNYEVMQKANGELQISEKLQISELIAVRDQHDQKKEKSTINANILSPVIMKRYPEKSKQQQQHSVRISNASVATSKSSAVYPTSVKSALNNSTTTTPKMITQKSSSLGIQQLSVTVSMQMGNVLDDKNKGEKENAGYVRSNMKLSTTPPRGVLTMDAKKERKINNYFTIIGQKNGNC